MKKLSKKQKLIILISIIIIIVILGLIIGANIIRTNIANNSYKSSNSNSSNGNLLPEYIKKGITLGGVTGTLESLDTSDATATAEDIAWGKTAYVDGKKITGTYLTLGMLQVGDYVAYTPDSAEGYSLPTTVTGYSSDKTITQESLNWRVVSINDDGTVDLMSATPTTQTIGFGGALGYNNSVYLLNDVAASLYSNSSLGVTARNINLEDDIEPKMNDTGIAYRNSYGAGGTYAYGNVQTYSSSSNRYYPNLYAQEIGSGIDTGAAREDGIAKNDSYYDSPTDETSSYADTSLTVTSDFYLFSVKSSYFDDQTWYNMVFSTSSTYWLASRCVYANSTYAQFRLRNVGSGGLSGSYLYGSDDRPVTSSICFRPLVSLSANLKITSGTGADPDHAYGIE